VITQVAAVSASPVLTRLPPQPLVEDCLAASEVIAVMSRIEWRRMVQLSQAS